MKSTAHNQRAESSRRPGRRSRHANRGFSLIETVTVMAIAAILLGMAVPSFKFVTNSNRIAAEINGLLGDLQFARIEAVKEGQTVTACVSTDGANCVASNAWNSGWIVFSDVNGDGIRSAGDTVLRVQGAFKSTDTFNASNGVTAVTFNREGFATGASIAGGSLITLHTLNPSIASTRCLFVTMLGQISVLNGNGSFGQFTCT